MRISERIEGTIENWRIKWGDTLKGWMQSWFEKGIEQLFDAFEPDVRAEVTPQLNQLKAIPNLPAEWHNVLEKATTSPSFIQFAALVPYLIGALVGLAMGSVAPIANWGRYFTDKLIHSARLDPFIAIRAYWRGFITEDYLKDVLADQGWSDDDIQHLRDVSLFVPTAGDIVSWYAREVYEPEMIRTYGLDDELPAYEETDFPKIGVDRQQATNYWRAHWMHASWMQVVEMLRRGQLTEDEVRRWFRVVEIPPYWRDKLIAISYAVPTRVDVRRWWDMRTITEERLREVYAWQGYHGKDLDDYVLWTKVYVAFPDLIARWKNGWITEDDVRSELIALGMPSDRVEEMIQTKIKPTQPERVEGEKSLTKAEIYAGVKKGVIGWDEGLDLLQDLGYGLEEAQFILEVRVGALEGSPDTYMEFKKWTQDFRKAMGLEAKIPPQELLDAGKALRDAEIALKEQEEKGVKGEKLAPYTKAVSDATYRYRQLLAKFKEGT